MRRRWRAASSPQPRDSASAAKAAAAAREGVELADGDDVLHLVDEVVLLQTEQVERCFAGVQAGAGVGDETDRRLQPRPQSSGPAAAPCDPGDAGPRSWRGRRQARVDGQPNFTPAHSRSTAFLWQLVPRTVLGLLGGHWGDDIALEVSAP
jgi:hypothetical protein